jgi:hypothetical protein
VAVAVGQVDLAVQVGIKGRPVACSGEMIAKGPVLRLLVDQGIAQGVEQHMQILLHLDQMVFAEGLGLVQVEGAQIITVEHQIVGAAVAAQDTVGDALAFPWILIDQAGIAQGFLAFPVKLIHDPLAGKIAMQEIA